MDSRTASRQLALRIPVGVFFLNSGLGKRDADEETAQQLHGFACGTYPFLRRLQAQRFVRLLSAGEIALGVALLAPVVPAAVAGAGLTGFALGTLGLYLRTPGMRQEGSLKPTEQGIPLAKDLWMAGIGLSLLVDDLAARCGRASRDRSRRGARWRCR